MEKIYLKKEEKAIMFALRDEVYKENRSDSYYANKLSEKGLISSVGFDGNLYTSLTDDGEEYLKRNPKLKNPSIWDNKVFVIGTSLTIIGILTRIIIAILKN